MPKRPRLPGDPQKPPKKRLEPPSTDSILRLVAAIIYFLANLV